VKKSAQRKLLDQELYDEMQPVYYNNYINEMQRRDKKIQNLIRSA